MFKLLYHAEIATALWVATIACMLAGTFWINARLPFYWGLMLSAAAATATITYYLRRNRRRCDRALEILLDALDDRPEHTGPTHIAR